MKPYVTRLAPSPTGALHLGNARTFLITWLRCREQNGHLIMRMDDLDHPKVKPDKIQQAYDDLHWLGIDWDEGEESPGANAPYVQSSRMVLYREAFETLRHQGLIYPCTCSRADIEAAQSAPHAEDELLYPNTCRGKYDNYTHAESESGKIPAWRFHAPNGESHFTDNFCGTQVEDLQVISGDFVIARGADKPAYQLACVVDDIKMGVSEVIRADDLLASTHRQIALYEALGAHEPEFLHLPLIIGKDGRRLAKRHGDTRISHIRENGVNAEKVLGWLAYTCGWGKMGEELTLEEIQTRYDLKTIPKKPYVLSEQDKDYLGVDE